MGRSGFLRANDPAVGGGAMVIALAREILAQGINYQSHLHVTAVDVDIRAVHMPYIQLLCSSLCLTPSPWGVAYTGFYTYALCNRILA